MMVNVLPGRDMDSGLTEAQKREVDAVLAEYMTRLQGLDKTQAMSVLVNLVAWWFCDESGRHLDDFMHNVGVTIDGQPNLG